MADVPPITRSSILRWSSSFFFDDTATTELYTLSLHDALPICGERGQHGRPLGFALDRTPRTFEPKRKDRKSTRLNSSHLGRSYAAFCLKKNIGDCHSVARSRYRQQHARLCILSQDHLGHAIRA